ncbi:alpha/beta-hydrolase [Violaceomyces palustris]|uniref:Alpha/beta-hydrolase n=1 Tax=Violaceomyces palustris TaxID=1673888 RepID=A0ACD0NME2_9BASI|nr:alpha/beta-hydrolase [Violaceomyces palustris]
MAKDVLELLDHVGWTSERTVHLVGVSMGGMISLELAKQQPTRFASLTLISTAPGRRHRTPIQGVASLARVLGGRILGFDSDSYRLNRLMDTLFPQIWLEEKCERDPKGRTNRENIYELFAWRYKFNKRQNVHGAMAQIKAALTHHVSDEDLIRIDSSVPRIAILTGDEDHLVNPRNSEYLRIKLSKATYHHFENTGHAIGLQHTTRLNQLLIQVFEEGEQEVRKGGW